VSPCYIFSQTGTEKLQALYFLLIQQLQGF